LIGHLLFQYLFNEPAECALSVDSRNISSQATFTLIWDCIF